jgi:hypothetical protein
MGKELVAQIDGRSFGIGNVNKQPAVVCPPLVPHLNMPTVPARVPKHAADARLASSERAAVVLCVSFVVNRTQMLWIDA